MTTCQASEVPKGSKLSFEASGKLSGSSLVAAQRGTTVSVEKLFHNLPVRRRELERNIKREWHKVISLLNQYACIQTNLKFSVSQQPTKGKRILLFSTKGNLTTRDNIINIFGAKTMTALVPLDLKLQLRPTRGAAGISSTNNKHGGPQDVRVVGHVSRPAHGEGRQTPDRQMFFVNGRPCGLPQFAKTFNEVYRSYNSSQNPFILADIQLDTHMYDVNVSPDKRSILLHDQNDMLDTLRESLVTLFDSHDYTMPTSEVIKPRQPVSKDEATKAVLPHAQSHNPIHSSTSEDSDSSSEGDMDSQEPSSIQTQRIPSGPARKISSSTRSLSKDTHGQNLISRWVERQPSSREESTTTTRRTTEAVSKSDRSVSEVTTDLVVSSRDLPTSLRALRDVDDGKPLAVRDFNNRLEEAGGGAFERILPPSSPSSKSLTPSSEVSEVDEPAIPSVKVFKHGPTPGARIRASPKRPAMEPATVVIGGDTIIGTPNIETRRSTRTQNLAADKSEPSFGNRLSSLFSAQPSMSPPVATDQGIHGVDTHSDSSSESADTDISDDELQNSSPPGSTSHEVRTTNLTFPPLPTSSGEMTDSEDQVERDRQESTVVDDSRMKEPADSQLRSLKGAAKRKDATLHLIQNLRLDDDIILSSLENWTDSLPCRREPEPQEFRVADLDATDAEEKLSLIIARKDFLKMRIAGQFNLGFIIATRPGIPAAVEGDTRGGSSTDDELFIIDQHATDEKYNFERLQATTVVQSQRLVHPKRLELTALEEEVILQNIEAIETNGFKIDVDLSGDEPVGSRCQLLALPLSRETTFDLSDLEELISLLGDQPAESKHVPRPSKVRKMFAMRACRSSIMIGKALTHSQMETLVRHMGELNKPWNCPHGRPTMRHLCKLQSWDDKGWNADRKFGTSISWQGYAQGV